MFSRFPLLTTDVLALVWRRRQEGRRGFAPAFFVAGIQGGDASRFKANQQKQALSRTEKAALATNESAWATIHDEAAAGENNTERLRRERLTKEASEPLAEKPKTEQSRRTKS